MANDLIPYKRPGDDVTGLATAAITGKRCVQITATKSHVTETLAPDPLTVGGDLYQVGHPNAGGRALGAGKRVFGVAKYDAPLGGKVGIAKEGIVPITCGAAVQAGVEVEVNAAGQVIPLAAGIAIGLCCNDAAINTDAEIDLYEN
jgi:predicted RecA/RadA family phage recombinase